MKKNKVSMVISILVVISLFVYMIVPMFSMAENEELNINLTKVEINNGYKINIAGSSPSKIEALSYINEKKTLADFNNNAEAIIAYFEGDKATKINITTEKYINETIDVKNLGNYTIYLRNVEGEIQLSYITISDKVEINLTAVAQETNDSKSIVINTSSTSNIVAVKVVRTDDARTPANFTNVTNLINVVGTVVEIEYPILENGIYQVYVEDANKNKKIQTINVFDGETPISINTEVNGNDVIIKVKDSISNIQIIKIALKSEISAIADFGTKGNEIDFEGTNDITVNYNVNAEGEYVIFAKDTAGNAFMKSVIINNISEQLVIPEEEQQPTIPEEQQPTIPDEQQPTTPEEQQPITPDEQQPTTSDEQQPIVIENQEPIQQINNEGIIDLNEIKNDNIDDFQQIKDVTVQDITTIEKIQTSEGVIEQNKTESNLRYPQTGTNNIIVIVGIIISTLVAIVSYKKMKNER